MNFPQNEMDTILNGIRDFILIISPDREILKVNDAFLKHMNYAREDVIGRKCYEVFKEVTRKSSNCHSKCPLEKVIREKRHCQAELTRLGSDGKIKYTELTIFPIWEKKGKISKFIEISRDITKRKTDEKQNQDHLRKMVEERTRQLKETHERMLHQDKMASLGKLSSSVVHEINNPVAGILNLIMLCKRILKEDDIKHDELDLFGQYLDLMETEIRRIGRIVSNLLVFARHSKIEVVKFDVNELIEQTLILNSNLLKINKIRVIEELEHNLPLICGSEDQLKQVIMNLISNAVESMSRVSKKRLTIRTFSKPEKKAVGIEVGDTGAGISQEMISKIFEPFFTTKQKGKGVGLGLSVVYGIIKEHGGRLFVDSTPEKGTLFSITLFQELDQKKSGSTLSLPDQPG
ncbi:PAS domain-containing sensor histidine kinase [Desulfobacula toluolica]|uniref:histidine kinase n=1 Tax=Desulfobacula toluolica (strain DSM 7467 / Tol2) TaxID=651182 RepID=K0NEW8_DESTT|nr:ATP-binding protein [Desulfobacula toluolica]CCK79485.1 two component system sensor histidine kinase [Desulfobacula toluolica Tol2]